MLALDKRFLNAFNKKTYPKQQTFWKIFADARLLAITLYGLPCLYFLLQKNLLAILALSLSVVACLALGYGLKAVILRPRPHNFVTYLGKFDSSFPSLHSLCAFCLAFQLASIMPTLTIIWFGIALLIAMARMYIQVHYFTDVLGGIILGFIIARFTLFIF